MNDVFISYHTKSASDIVLKVCKALENAGITCWYAPRDVSGAFAHSIIEAIRVCKVFLLILNNGANKSGHVLNEVSYAFDRFQKKEGIELLPFRVDDCTLCDDMRYYLGRIHIMDGGRMPDNIHVQELVHRIIKLLKKEPYRLSQDNLQRSLQDEKSYRLVTTLVYPDKHFVGREAELTDIKTKLSNVNNKVFLVGMGGIGKSEIARMYLNRHALDYEVVMWVPFSESLEHTISNDDLLPIEGMSHIDYPTDTQQEYAKRKLDLLKKIADRKILIVIDNFDVQNDPLLQSFCSGQYAVIFTTRYHQLENWIQEIDILSIIDDADLMRLFCAEYRRNTGSQDEKIVLRIIYLLEKHTLSIRLVASLMQSGRIRPAQMLSLLEDDNAKTAQLNKKLPDQIFSRLKMVFRLSTLNDEELFVMKNLSLISNKGIEIESFREWNELDGFDVIDGLINKNWIISDYTYDIIHLHPLIADLMLEELKKDPQCCFTMLGNFYQRAINTRGTSVEAKQRYVDIANTSWDRLPQNHPYRSKMLEAKIDTTAALSLYRMTFPDCQLLISEANSLDQKLYGYIKYGQSHSLLGEVEEGLRIAQEGYSLVKDIPNEKLSKREGYLRIRLLSRLAIANNMLGNYESALYYATKNYTLYHPMFWSKINAPEGWPKLHMAKALYNLGRLDEGEVAIRSSLSHFESINDEWSKGHAYEVLSFFLARKNDYRNAFDLNDKARELLIATMGSEHLDVAGVWDNRGKLFSLQMSKVDACSCWEKSILIYEKVGATRRIETVNRNMKNLLSGGEWIFPII